jgi:hypothetical protein
MNLTSKTLTCFVAIVLQGLGGVVAAEHMYDKVSD